MEQKLIKDFEIPSKKIETWKFTDLKKVFEKNNFKPYKKSIAEKNPATSKINSSIANNTFFDTKINYVIFEDGYLQKLKKKSNGLEIIDLNENSKKTLFNKNNFIRNDSLLDINNTFLNGNLIIRVKKDIKLKEPISIFYFNSEESKYLINNRINIILEENAEAEIYEVFISSGQISYWNNVHNFIQLKKSSKLNHYKIQMESKYALHSSSSNVSCNNSSNYNSFIYSFGGIMSRIEIIGSINSSDINFNIKGLYLAKVNQHHDITTLMQHKHSNSNSNQHIKGILQKKSSGVFQGKVIVSQNAQKTDAFQFNQNLLLSENAKINTKPELEIYADDVKCSHGATTGELDEEMLFYLRSRGLKEEEARKLLIEGFINELFEDIENKKLKKKLLHTSIKSIYLK